MERGRRRKIRKKREEEEKEGEEEKEEKERMTCFVSIKSRVFQQLFPKLARNVYPYAPSSSIFRPSALATLAHVVPVTDVSCLPGEERQRPPALQELVESIPRMPDGKVIPLNYGR